MAGADPKSLIRARALSLGFDAVGFCRAELGPEARARLRDFLSAGQHGDMGWLAERAEQRGHPRSLWPEARSVVALGLSYAPEDDPLAVLGRPDRGAISVYARNRDYHDVVKGMLKHLAQFIASRCGEQVKVFVDTAPVMEKPLAERAGLGWQGKHTNLVSRAHGSWLFLGEIYTTLELAPDPPHADRCGSCTRCQEVCPTHAFPAPYRLDATRCISYLTIEHHGPIPHELRPLMGNRIYGCDDCLAVCPWNRFARATPHDKLRARADLERTTPCRTRRPRRCRVPADVCRLAGQAAGEKPVRAQRADRDRQFRRCHAAPRRRQADRRPRSGGRRGGGLGGLAVGRWGGSLSGLVKRSFSLAGHRTSVALETEFWSALAAIAGARGKTLSALVAEADAAREPGRPLASALRLLALRECAAAAGAA